MKLIDSGYGNSSDMIFVRERAYKNKAYRYIVISTSGGHPGAIGGSFNYTVEGTDAIKELFEPDVIEAGGEIIDTKSGKCVERSQLAKQYLKSLNKKEKAELTNRVLINYLGNE